jgi:DNA polymerase III delta prime subunit
LENATSSIRGIEEELVLIRQRLGIKDTQDLLQWIAPLNVSYEAYYKDARKRAWPGTGKWLLKSSEYERWTTGGGCFCLYGPPGSGKTILSSAIVNDLEQRTKARSVDKCCVLYYFFDTRDAWKNTTKGLYDSLIRQLLQNDVSGYGALLDLGLKQSNGPPTSGMRLELILELLQRLAENQIVYIVIDGCEECTDFLGDDNLRFLEKLLAWARGGGSNTDNADILQINKGTSSDSKLKKTDINNKNHSGKINILLSTQNHAVFRIMKAGDNYKGITLPNSSHQDDIIKYVTENIVTMDAWALQEIQTTEGLLDKTVRQIVDNSDGL